ncbi:MAG: undecaprenyldiphospho-muramoylpentapeptide beta-N-acetylglucosaminyltransferase [Clostridia bacterium]
MKVLFTGGGTAGHINPALAAASYLKKKNPDVDILYVGNRGGMEERIVPKAGYKFKSVKISGFQRRLSLKNIGRNMATVVRIVTSSVEAKKIIKEFAPDVCVGTGGYVSGPVIREAAKMGIPCVVHESNAFPGVTIKMLSKKVHTVMIAVDAAKTHFDPSVNLKVTGNPIRPEIMMANKELAKARLGLDERPVVLSVGGSLGAEKLNEAIIPVIKNSIENKNYQHIHSTGYGKITKEHEELASSSIKMMEYVNMVQCLAAADVVISRAGAITVTEIAATENASILIPSPFVAENHQFHNAMTLVNLGAAEIIEEKNLNPQILQEKIDSVLKTEGKSKIMGEKAKQIYVEDANEQIYNIIINAAKK